MLEATTGHSLALDLLFPFPSSWNLLGGFAFNCNSIQIITNERTMLSNSQLSDELNRNNNILIITSSMC